MLIKIISERQIAVLEADLDDVLIDLEMHDIIDVVRVFSKLAAPKQSNNIPKLFDQEKP